MAKVSEKVQEAIFSQLLSIPANAECADCRTSSPTWVSLDFGVFLCMRCSGVHRQIGPHITRVRSVRLDGWTKDNIEIMATVGNQVANDFYENATSGYSRKPGTNSSPEECRRYVDDKYINKKFAVQGFQDPVKEFLASKAKGTKPDFSYSTQKPSQQLQQQSQTQAQNHHQQQKQEVHHRNHSTESPHVNLASLRKKSMSLDKYPRDPAHDKAHHLHQDLLSADDDLLGGCGQGHVQTNVHTHPHAHSASPAKINFAKFRKGNNAQPTQPQENPSTTQWTLDLTAGDQNQSQNQNQNQNQNDKNNALFNMPGATSQPQIQQQAQPQIDLKQLYNQGGHQNHFMQAQTRQNWGYHQGGMNPPQSFPGGFNGGYNAGGMGMPQNNGHFNQNFGMQPGYNQQMGGYQQPMNYNGNMGGGSQMGYNQPFAQPQNQYQNNGFVQVQNNNKFF